MNDEDQAQESTKTSAADATSAQALRGLLAESQQRRETAAVAAMSAWQAITAAEQQVADARDAYTVAWETAMSAGWTPGELKRLDLATPEPKTRRRRSRASRTQRKPPTR